MRQVWPTAGTALVYAILCLPALAGQVYEGSGQIVSGPGQGGSVNLRLEIEGNRVRSLSGPPLDGNIQSDGSLNGVVRMGANTWRIEQCGADLCVQLQQAQPKRSIHYRLSSR